GVRREGRDAALPRAAALEPVRVLDVPGELKPMRPLVLGLTLIAALAMAGCSSQVAHQPAPDPVTRPAPAPISDTLKVDQGAGPDPSVVIDHGPITIRRVYAEYPDVARSKHVQGLVRVQALVGTDGRVDDARMVESIPLLDEAAMAAVRQWEFEPAMARGN